VLGPAAGVLVAIYVFSRNMKNAIPFLISYGIIAGLVAYMTWPFLWGAPLQHYLEALKAMSNYHWTDPVLFNGVNFSPKKLPWFYLPELLSVQLTEPVLVLFVWGLFTMIFRRPKFMVGEKIILIIWLAVPLVMPIVLHSRLYDNFRHFFFVLPPLFIIAGVGLEFILKRINSPILKVGLLLLLAIPGIYSGVSLHPYEYVYYNSFVGQTGKNLADKFELDYWATSYREAALYINEIAPIGSRVIVFGPDKIFSEYVRSDLTVVNSSQVKKQDDAYDYFVTTTRWNSHLKSCPASEIIYSLQRNGAVFSVVKKISAEDISCP
jgi:hypothetical protein